MKKKAIIFGVSGQDGSYLAKLLLEKKYSVLGVTRNTSKENLFRLTKLGILDKIKLIKGTAIDDNFLKKLFKRNNNISEIYYLAGYSSVINSFIFPKESLISNTLGILNILLYVKNSKKKIKVFNAGSGQFYGDNKNNKYNLNSKIDPQSPYGISKATGYWLVKVFRENYDIFCCTGILFNHESSLRSDEFVTKKIINISKKIKKNNRLNLKLGNINIYRDWGWAPEYVEGFWLMLQQKSPSDLILGTGKVHSVKEFVNEVFKLLNIKKKHLNTNVKKFKRKLDIRGYKADISETKKKIKWQPKTNFKKIIYKMVNDELF